MRKTVSIFLLSIVLFACGAKTATQNKAIVEQKITVPEFSSDSAYNYVKAQVDFGPRVPNTPAHTQCAAYLSNSLKQFGAVVTEQKMKLRAFNGDVLNAVNIIGSINPEAPKRILLMSHWDSRPWSDHDPDPASKTKPVPAANDGASGVGVLLEIARVLQSQTPDVGVDIVFFDAEDYGAPSDFKGDAEDSWCLGSQYWSKRPHIPGYSANFGILLDMVGAPGARFMKEQISLYYAPQVVDNVWHTAETLGYSAYFINENGGGITDDHVYVNQIANIPSIDIIQYDSNSESGFAEYWHTSKDDMSNIDKQTLKVVGSTLLHVIYNYQK